MKTRFVIFLLGLICFQAILAQLPHKFTQYNNSDGLGQARIMNIIQDHKGFMWFSTWNGFYKFDGYSFKGYKNHIKGEEYGPINDRIEYITEDKNGYIWTLNYDK